MIKSNIWVRRLEYGKKVEEFNCGPSSHLERAKRCLKKTEPEFLFYAALELRYFVESRQALYLDAQEKYIESIPRRWKIGHQAKALRQVYDREEIQQATATFEDGCKFVFRYVPVSTSLKNNAERLGQLLHSQKGSPTSQYLTEIREFLHETSAMAIACEAGNLLAPLLLDVKTGKPEGKFQILLPPSEEQKLKDSLSAGYQIKMNIEYHSIE